MTLITVEVDRRWLEILAKLQESMMYPEGTPEPSPKVTINKLNKIYQKNRIVVDAMIEEGYAFMAASEEHGAYIVPSPIGGFILYQYAKSNIKEPQLKILEKG